MTRIGITGHQSIPEEALGYVQAEIGRLLSAVGGGIRGISSLAAGADQLFARSILELGGELHAVIPSRGYESAFSDPAAAATYHELLGRAQVVERLDFEAPSEEAFWAAGCRVVELSDAIVAVWDGMPARGLGGTADVVAYARSSGVETVTVWPAGVVRDPAR